VKIMKQADVRIYKNSPKREMSCVCGHSPAAIEWMLENVKFANFDGYSAVVDTSVLDELLESIAAAGLSVKVID